MQIKITSSDKLHRPEQNTTWHARDRDEIKRLEADHSVTTKVRKKLELSLKPAMEASKPALKLGSTPKPAATAAKAKSTLPSPAAPAESSGFTEPKI